MPLGASLPAGPASCTDRHAPRDCDRANVTLNAQATQQNVTAGITGAQAAITQNFTLGLEQTEVGGGSTSSSSSSSRARLPLPMKITTKPSG